MEIKQAIYAAVIGEQMNNKVIFTTGEAVNSGNSTFASRTIGNSRKVTGHNPIFKPASTKNFPSLANSENFSSSSSNLSSSHSSSSSSSSNLNSSFDSLNISSSSSSSSVYPDTNFSTPTIKELENNSDRLISSIKTADHIARGEIHPEGMKALMSLLDPNKSGQYTVNDASVSGEQAAQELAKRTSSEVAAETEITGHLPINLRMILGDISLAVIRGENGDPELSVRTTLSGKEADTKLEAIIVHLNTAVGSRTGSNSSSAQNIFFGSNGRRYLRLSDGSSIGLPSENVFTSGMKFTFEGSGRTQFSLSLSDFDEKNKKCWDILKESGVAEAMPSDLPANGSSGLIGAWKRRNLASTLLKHFGLDPEDLDNEWDGGKNFADQVAGQRVAILDFARGLLSGESDMSVHTSPEFGDFNARILKKLDDLKLENDEFENDEFDVEDNDEFDVDDEEQAAGNTEFADALEKILKEIRRESDIFRSNESLQFSLGLLRAAHEGDTALQNFLNSWLINQAQASATADADADGNYEDGSGNFSFVPIDLSNVETPEAYIPKDNPDAARLDAELEKLGVK